MNPCPVLGCTDHARPGQLMCVKHWRMVPSQLQRDVYSTWRAVRHGSGGVKVKLEAIKVYRAAAAAAVANVKAQESPLCA